MAERIAFHIIGAILRTPVGAVLKFVSDRFYPEDIEDWIEVRNIDLFLPNLPPAFDGYRLIQISDIHIGTWLSRKHLDQVVEIVNQQQPDAIAITGDFVTYEPENFLDELTEALGNLQSKDPIVAVLGNHDHWTDPAVVRKVLHSAGIKELANRVHTLQRNGSALHLAGVDDIMVEQDCLDCVLDALPKDGAAILLAHEPDFAEKSAATGRFDLQLSGHTHGGQIQLPRIGAPYLPRMGRKYPSGLYKVEEMYLYTNRGLGTAEFQVRYNCPAEITVFTLSSSNSFKDS